MRRSPITTRKTKFDADWKPSRSEKKYAICGKIAAIKKQKLKKSQKSESGVLIFDVCSLRVTNMSTKIAHRTIVHLSMGLIVTS